jgi:hypothetical protein
MLCILISKHRSTYLPFTYQCRSYFTDEQDHSYYGQDHRCAHGSQYGKFILSQNVQFKISMYTTSPMRPIACESDDMILIAPMSCKMSSAAIVSARIRDSANATSSGMFLSRWWQTICSKSECIIIFLLSILNSILMRWLLTSISRCSSIVFAVNGRVGFVEEGKTFLTPHTLIISGA